MLRRALTLGMLPGLLLFALLFAAGTYSLAQLKADPDPDTARVLEHFSTKVYLTLARIGLVHLWAGVVLGALAGLVVALLHPRLLERRVAFLAAAFLVLTVFCAYLTSRLLIRQPTFFDQFLFAHGGPWRWLQVQLTDHVGLRGLDLAAAALLVLLLATSGNFRSVVPRGRPRTRGQLLFGLLLGMTALASALQFLWSPPQPEQPDRPNILLLCVDSVRPDHLSFEGYGRQTSPHLDALAKQSRVFEQAFVPLARTLPSWTSLLTSTDPHTHGIRHMFPESGRRRIPLPTLAEELAADGYRSAVVSDFAGEMFDLIDYGFDLVDTPPASDVDVLVERQMLLHFPLVFPFVNHRLGKRVLPVMSYLTINADASSLARRALRRIRELADHGPFFVTVFFSTTHTPYASPYPYYGKFTDPEYEGRHRYAYGVRDPRDLAEGIPALTRADQDQIVALYDGAIAAVDDAIGEILEELEGWNFMDSTLVIVTADHGEHLFEGGNELDHGKWFRGGDHANHVPWILYDPEEVLGTGPVPELVRSIDLMPTLLGRLGLPVPETCEGTDLSPYLKSGAPLPALDLFAETGVWLKAPATFASDPDALIYPPINELLDPDPHDDTLILGPVRELVVTAKHRMVRDLEYKLTMEPTRDGVRYRLHDVNRDPHGARDLAAEEPEILAAYREKLDRWLLRDPCRRFDAQGHLVPWFNDLE